MGYKYWITKMNYKFYAFIKINQVAKTKATYMITKSSSYTPEDPSTFWDFFDNFDGTALSDNWIDTNVSGSYSVSDGYLNMWNDWGVCCNGGCYYSGIESTNTYDLPLQLLIAGFQDNYEEYSSCGRTGLTVAYKNSIQIATSTDTNTREGGASYRIGSSKGWIGVKPIPNTDPEDYGFLLNMHSNGVEFTCHWDDGANQVIQIELNSPYTSGMPIVISGDTDSSTVIDRANYIAMAKGRQPYPKVTVLNVTSDALIFEVDDTASATDEDMVDFIIAVDVTGFVSDVTEGLDIRNIDIYTLFKDLESGNVYYYDSTNNALVNLNKTEDDLTVEDFTDYGVKNNFDISSQVFSDVGISQFEFLNYIEDSTTSYIIDSITFQPKKQIWVSTKPIKLVDFTSFIKFDIYDINDNWDDYGVGSYIKMIVSRDGKNWYTWDSDNGVWKYLGERTLDVYNSDDITWVDTNGNYRVKYTDLSEEAWENFFGGEPDQIYFAFVENIEDIRLTSRFYEILATVDTKTSYVIDYDPIIKVTQNTFYVTFPNAGDYQILYED